MQATPLTEGCTIVAIVLGLIGLYLDSLAAVAGAMGLTGLLCGQGALFLYRTARYANDLQVVRQVKGRPVYLGIPVEVSTKVTTSAVQGLHVRLTDLPPRSAVYVYDEAVLRDGEGRYQVRFMTPGEVSFRGLQIETANPFFTTSIFHAAPRYVGEKVLVLPVEMGTSRPAPGAGSGGTELARAGALQGEGIRGFRPFRQGDDPARVDWKLTAKHGRPFVREPNSEAGNAPLIVVDLPAPEASGAVAVLSAASSEIRREIREYGKCTLLLIAGGEVIAFYRHEPNLVGLLRLLGLQPPESIHPLYRIKDPVVLMARFRAAERELFLPSQRLAVALRVALGARVRSAFEKEVDQVLAATEHREVVVYTASSADTSHLNLIATAARRRRRRLVIRVPRSQQGSIAWLSPYPRVEAI